MTPSKLRAWMQEHGEPISIREIAALRQAETGTFSEKRIQRSMKALETAGLVEFETGGHNTKLWKLVKPTKPNEEGATEPEVEAAANGIAPDYAKSAE